MGLRPQNALRFFHSLWILFLGPILYSNANEGEIGQTMSASVLPSSFRAKDLANYTVIMPKYDGNIALGGLALLKIRFPVDYNFWVSDSVQIRDYSGFKILADAPVKKNGDGTELMFKLSRVLNQHEPNLTFVISNIVNPNSTRDISSLTIDLFEDHNMRILAKYEVNQLRFKPMFPSKIKILNQHTEFLPGFYTSYFTAQASNVYLYETRIKVISTHPLIVPVPAEFTIRADYPLNQTRADGFDFIFEGAFRLKIGRNTPLGRYSLRFEVVEFNQENHFHPIEKVEFEVKIPPPQLSAALPAPFRGPKPLLAFSKKSLNAALGNPSAPQMLQLTPSPAETVAVQVRTTLPDQPEKIEIAPSSLGISENSGEAMFVVTPKVGAVSGYLHLHIPDPFYRTNIQILERRAALEVVYAEVEQEHLRLQVDSRPLHNVTFGPFSLARAAKLATNPARDLQVQSSVQLGANHQVMVMFVFIKNISRLGTDRLLLPKLRDLSPLDNGTLVDLGDHSAVYFAYPEYTSATQSFLLELDVSRREFLTFSDFKIVPMFRDCQGEVFLVDYYFKKVENYNLKLMRLNFDVPPGFSQPTLLRLLESMTPLKGSLAATTSNSTNNSRESGQNQPTNLSPTSDITLSSRQSLSFVLLTDHSAEKVRQLLANTFLNKKHVPTLRYYVYMESSLLVPSNSDWVRLASVEEVAVDSVHVDIQLEDLGDKFIHYGMQITLGPLEDFRPFLDFTALLRIKRHHYNLNADDAAQTVEQRDIDDSSSRLAVFGGPDLQSSAKFHGLNPSEEYFLEARPCVSFRGRSLCAPKVVGLSVHPEQIACRDPPSTTLRRLRLQRCWMGRLSHQNSHFRIWLTLVRHVM